MVLMVAYRFCTPMVSVRFRLLAPTRKGKFMKMNRKRYIRLFLFLWCLLIVTIIITGAIMLTGGDESLDIVNRVYNPEVEIKESKVEPVEEKPDELIESAKEFIDDAAKQATELLNKLDDKNEEEVNTNEDESSSIFDYWWTVLIGLWFLSKLFGGD